MQTNGMPQFGIQNHNQDNKQDKPLHIQTSQAVVFGPRPSQPVRTESVPEVAAGITAETTAGTEEANKPKEIKASTSLRKEQVLPALVAVFGFLALIFLVSTIALAVSRPVVVDNYTAKQEETETIVLPTAPEELSFSPKKIENPVESGSYKIGPSVYNADGHQVLAAYINTAGSGLTFEVNWEFANTYYKTSLIRVDQESFKVSTDEPVTDAVIGRVGSDNLDDVLLLLTNGKVAYMPIRESMEEYDFKVYGEIEDISDAAKFYKVYEEINGEFVETVMVQKADGGIVDLRPQLLRIVGKDVK